LQLSSPVAVVAKEEPHRIPHVFVLVSFGFFLAVSDFFFPGQTFFNKTFFKANLEVKVTKQDSVAPKQDLFSRR
jgi:hypothetical protein